MVESGPVARVKAMKAPDHVAESERVEVDESSE